jgi:hypothetical protein
MPDTCSPEHDIGPALVRDGGSHVDCRAEVVNFDHLNRGHASMTDTPDTEQRLTVHRAAQVSA